MDTAAPGIPSIRTFDLIVPVSGYLEGELDDWPAVIQDGVYAALERKAHEVELPLVIIASRGGMDEDKQDHEPGRFYVHIVASEVVMADVRTLKPGTVAEPRSKRNPMWRQ